MKQKVKKAENPIDINKSISEMSEEQKSHVDTAMKNNNMNDIIEGKGLRPCDCKDAVDTSMLNEQGIGHNDESIIVIPNYVLLKMGHTQIKISMSRFKMFAEWYLTPQLDEKKL